MTILKACLLSGIICLTPTAVLAQIVPDGTTSTTVNSNNNVDTIEAGEQIGDNLFHSFAEFSVMNGREAFFNNGLDINHIFSRVTGGNVSTIDGLIRANGNANLFLINPAGIIFNDGARLDLGGSFYGTTSDSILGANGVEFGVNSPEVPNLIINAPIGLNLRDNPGDITVNNANLSVDSGQSLNLIGGEINLNGSNLSAFEGQVNLAGISSAGTVSLTASGLDLGNLALADISLSNGATINVNRGGAGAIAINAQNLTLLEESILNGGIDSASSTANTQAGNVTLNVADTLALESGSLIRNNLSSQSTGNAGDIVVTAQNLSINDGARIITFSQGQGNTGNILIDAPGSISLNREGQINSQVAANTVGNAGDITLNTTALSLGSSSLIFTNVLGEGNAGNLNLTASDRITLDNSNLQARVEAGGVGNSGNININTGSLSLNDTDQGLNAAILASTAGIGNAGNINITATDIALTGDSSIQTQVQSTADGTGGDITINTNNLSLTGNSRNSRASLLANSTGNGDAGNINLNATEQITLNQFALILSQGTAGTGNAGAINIDTAELSLSTGSLILSNTGDAESPNVTNIGDAGDITINAPTITLDSFSAITNSALSNATGQAGNVTIDTENLTIAQESTINVLTGTSENGGTVTINAQNIELLAGGKIVSLTESSGDAGDINLNVSDSLTINGSNAPLVTEEFRSAEIAIQNLEGRTGLFANTVNTFTTATGNGGSVQIQAPSTLSILNSGEITVDSQGTGNGGNLTIEAGSLSLDNQAQLIAETEFGQSEQQPSNINLDLDGVLTLEGDSQISARAFTNANGGNVAIAADFIVAFPAIVEGNDIIANATEGQGGTIEITAQEIFGLEEGNSSPGNMSNDLDVTSEFGFDGILELNTPDVDTTGGVTELPIGAISPETIVQQACAANSVKNSSFSLKGRGNIPQEAKDILSSELLLASEESAPANLPSQSNQPTTPPPIMTAQGAIYPARGIEVTPAGTVILTRAPKQSNRQSPVEANSSCLNSNVNPG